MRKVVNVAVGSNCDVRVVVSPRGSQFGRWLIAPSQDLDGPNSSATARAR
jgi:hypothetical protein